MSYKKTYECKDCIESCNLVVTYEDRDSGDGKPIACIFSIDYLFIWKEVKPKVTSLVVIGFYAHDAM